MGCDIHLYREVKKGDAWVSADRWEEIKYEGEEPSLHVNWSDRAYTGRNYDLFGVLCDGVRGRSFHFSCAGKGVPADCSENVLKVIKSWGDDAHSHSWLSFEELESIRETMQTTVITISGMMHKEQWVHLQRDLKKDSKNFQNLYPYCAITNQKDFVNFVVDVPADFVIGDGIEEIIDALDQYDAEEKRVVFFFDN